MYSPDTLVFIKTLKQFFVENKQGTISDIITYLKKKEPDYNWKFYWVSLRLSRFKIPTKLGNPHIYTDFPQKIDNYFYIVLDVLNSTGDLITKKNVKKVLDTYKIDYTKESLDVLFKTVQFTGNYTTENHKIYFYLPVGTHFSKTENNVVQIKDMHPNYIWNTIMQKYPKTPLEDCFKEDTEVFQLLKYYFNNKD